MKMATDGDDNDADGDDDADADDDDEEEEEDDDDDNEEDDDDDDDIVDDKAGTDSAQAQASSLSANGELLVRADHGQHGWIDIAGGNGYSGGGDAFPHPSAGGSDGSDGFGDGQEGRGTGEDISSFPFTNFQLTPGAGGARSGGGGGGGVLVDGEGPHRPHQGTGQGYGGGGEGSRETTEFTFEGLQGVVLIELTSK